MRPLAEISETYPTRVLTYLVTGNEVLILLNLQNLLNDKANTLLGSVSAFNWQTQSKTNLSQKQERLATQSENARTALYKHLFTALSAEQSPLPCLRARNFASLNRYLAVIQLLLGVSRRYRPTSI